MHWKNVEWELKFSPSLCDWGLAQACGLSQDFMYRIFSWVVDIENTGVWRFMAWLMTSIDNIEIIIVIIISFIARVWFGTIATKYENITSMPPI